MDNADTINCFNEVKESFLNTQLTEELALLTPRDVKSVVDSWATEDTDKERVTELIFEWLAQYRGLGTDEGLNKEEKHRLLLKTLSHAHSSLDYILIKRDRGLEEKERENFNKLTPEEQTEFLKNMPIRVRGEDHGKCKLERYKEDMEWLLEMVIPTNESRETRFFNLLKKMGYNFVDEINGYPYLLSFLSELMWYEFIICREVAPYTEELRSYNRYKHKPNDEIWLKRLNYYKNIGVKNKDRHSATIHGDKWAIPFNDFAKLYRAILGLSNKAIVSPLK